MTKRLVVCAVALLLVAGISLAGGKGKEKTFTGWITDTHCGAKGASGDHAACLQKCVNGGSKYALYTPADKKVYVLDPQDKVAEHAAHHVKVTGTIEGDTLKVSSIEMAPENKPAAKKTS